MVEFLRGRRRGKSTFCVRQNGEGREGGHTLKTTSCAMSSCKSEGACGLVPRSEYSSTKRRKWVERRTGGSQWRSGEGEEVDTYDESSIHEDTGGDSVENARSDGRRSSRHVQSLAKSESNGHTKGSTNRVHEGAGPRDPGVGRGELWGRKLVRKGRKMRKTRGTDLEEGKATAQTQPFKHLMKDNNDE